MSMAMRTKKNFIMDFSISESLIAWFLLRVLKEIPIRFWCWLAFDMKEVHLVKSFGDGN